MKNANRLKINLKDVEQIAESQGKANVLNEAKNIHEQLQDNTVQRLFFVKYWDEW